MKKILLIILLIILVAFGFKRFFLHPAAVVSTTPPPKEGKIVETSTVGESIFSEQIHITGKVAAQKEVSISTQTTGFIGSLAVKSGDKVTAGETLAHIQDTYGTTNNSIREASLGIQTAQLSQENSTTSLDQAVENTRIAYEKAQKDYAAAQL